MAQSPDTLSMALFCDFENVALGVRDAKYEKFDIKPVLERLLLKGSIVVKKAYCDWDRYKGFKATMHEANFELIEIPHVRQSGKNSADIRLVVDALDLCYTKSHVNTFVIISGDSDFSPLVSKLRENAKQVIGVGVKQSTSDLLIANCDEFIFYDDLVREKQRSSARRQSTDSPAAPRRTPEEDRARREDQERRRLAGVEMAVDTFEALVAERGDSGKIWASVLKEAIKRRNPGFSEGAYGFRTFGNLLEEAQALRLLAFGRDEKSGAYVFRHSGAAASPASPVNGGQATPATPARPEEPQERPASRYFQAEPAGMANPVAEAEPVATEPAEPSAPAGRGGRGARGRRGRSVDDQPVNPSVGADAGSPAEPAGVTADAPAEAATALAVEAATAPNEPRSRGRRTRKPAAQRGGSDDVMTDQTNGVSTPSAHTLPGDITADAASARDGKTPSRARRPRKTSPAPEGS